MAPGEEIELLNNARQGDRRSRDALYKRYFAGSKPVRALLAREEPNPAARPGLLHDACASLLRPASELSGDSSFDTLVYRAVQSAILRKLRRDRVGRDVRMVRLTREFDAVDDYQFEELDAGATAERLFSLLPEPLRTAFRLRVSHDMGYPEIAAAIQAPLQTGATRVFSAREHLAGFFGGPEKVNCRNPQLFELTPGRRAEGFGSIDEVHHELLWDLASGRAGTPEIKAHVDCCPDCAALAASFSRLHAALRRAEPGVFAVCPPAEALTAGHSEPISRHMESCPSCRDEARWLESSGPDRVTPFPVKRALAWGAAAVMLAVLVAFRESAAPASPYADLAQVPATDRTSLVHAQGLPERFRPQIEEALTAYEAKRFAEAEAKAAQVLTAFPSDPSALLVMALSAHGRGDAAAANRFMSQSEQAQPITPDRCWTALHLALLAADRQAIERECGHLQDHATYAARAAGILAEVRRRP